jgi:hypothetical protein
VTTRLSRRSRVGLALALVVAMAVGVGGWLVARAGDGTSIEATVRGFFEARQAGHCEQVVDYLSRSSWSEDGRLGRHEFLDHCEAAIDDYQPELADVAVVSETGDTAVVQMAIPLDDEALAPMPDLGDRAQGFVVGASMLTDDQRADVGADAAYEQGELVREGSTWKVRSDPWFLRIGRSVEQTVAGYLDSYRDGDCDEAIGFVSDGAWSTDSEADRQQFIDRCEAVAQSSAAYREESAHDPITVAHPSVVAAPTAVELTASGSDQVTAEVQWNGRPTQTVRFLRQDVTWQLTDPWLEVVRTADLSAHLLSEPDVGLPPATPALVHPDLRTDPFDAGPQGYEGADAAERRRDHGFQGGLTVSFGEHPYRVDLLAYEFTDAEGATQYAEHLGTRIADVATRYQELTSVEVTDVDGSLAVVTECAGPDFRPASQPVDCGQANRAAAVGARGRFVAAVEVVDYEGPDLPAGELVDQAINLLRTQLDRL